AHHERPRSSRARHPSGSEHRCDTPRDGRGECDLLRVYERQSQPLGQALGRRSPSFNNLMRTSDFDYQLPPALIAHEPARPRDSSRMMVLHRRTGGRVESRFRNLPDFLEPSDVLVLNDTRVIRARTYGRLERASGTSRGIEVLFAAPAGANVWEVLCRPARRIRPGDRVIFGESELTGVFGEPCDHGLRVLQFHPGSPVEEFLEARGHVPL